MDSNHEKKLQHYQSVAGKLDDESASLLLAELDSKDVVYLVNIIHIISGVPASQLCLLEKHGIPQKLIKILAEDNSLIVPHVLKFFCNIDTRVLGERYPQVVEIVSDLEKKTRTQILHRDLNVPSESQGNAQN